MEPTILFEDTHLVVLNKPPGLLSQGEATGDENLVDWLRAYFGRNYVGLVHRLDRNTSGLMVVAKRTKAANRLTEALQSGHLKRTYQALVEGKLDRPEEWVHWLKKDERTNTVRVVTPGNGKEARLTLVPLRSGGKPGAPVTLVEFTLDTGRSHQIRVQAQAQGHPLVGDRKYGSTRDYSRPALHSARLSFPHPMSGEVLRFEEKMPEEWERILGMDR